MFGAPAPYACCDSAMAVPMRSEPAMRFGITPLELAPASLSRKLAASRRPCAARPGAIGAVVSSIVLTIWSRGRLGNADRPRPRTAATAGDANDVPHSEPYCDPGWVDSTHPGPARSFHGPRNDHAYTESSDLVATTPMTPGDAAGYCGCVRSSLGRPGSALPAAARTITPLLPA